MNVAKIEGLCSKTTCFNAFNFSSNEHDIVSTSNGEMGITAYEKVIYDSLTTCFDVFSSSYSTSFY